MGIIPPAFQDPCSQPHTYCTCAPRSNCFPLSLDGCTRHVKILRAGKPERQNNPALPSCHAAGLVDSGMNPDWGPRLFHRSSGDPTVSTYCRLTAVSCPALLQGRLKEAFTCGRHPRHRCHQNKHRGRVKRMDHACPPQLQYVVVHTITPEPRPPWAWPCVSWALAAVPLAGATLENHL